MNYYERHIGDYLKDTAHLSLLEHGIYTRLLDVYYTRECGIPKDQVTRLIGARSKEEREALDAVLKEFFSIDDGDTWRQKRCDEVIAEHHAFISRQRNNAAKRWESHGNAADDAKQMPPHLNGIKVAIPPTPTPTPTPKRRRNASPKTSIPEGFGLSDPMRDYATSKIADVDASELFSAFCDQAKAKGWQYVNWEMAWQTYVRDCAPGSGHWAAGRYPKVGGGGKWM